MKNEKNKNYETILLERLEGKIDAIIEEQGIIKEKVEKIDSLETKVDSLVEDMDYVKSNLVDKTDRFKEVDAVADNHEKRIIKLENVALAKV